VPRVLIARCLWLKGELEAEEVGRVKNGCARLKMPLRKINPIDTFKKLPGKKDREFASKGWIHRKDDGGKLVCLGSDCANFRLVATETELSHSP